MPAPASKTVKPVTYAKPFLKWAGSKRQLLQQFADLYPPQLKTGAITHYYEPFLGSGAVFFDIAQHYQFKKITLSDVNEDLVLTYQVIQLHVDALLTVLHQREQQYLGLDKEKRTAFFYEQRAIFNQPRPTDRKNIDRQVARAAQLIFLNRTCFNGLFRVNSKGIFNTPAGDYARPRICDEENLKAVSGLLSGVTIRKNDFGPALRQAGPGAFVYLDPPYRPLSTTASFTAYNKSVFADEQQTALAAVCKSLHEKGVAVMLSNSDTRDNFFDHLYRDFHIRRIPARRLINANASGRGVVNELVITNYEV